MKSEKQVIQGLENNAKNVFTNKENDKSTTGYLDRLFEASMMELAFSEKLRFKVRVRFLFAKTVLHRTASLIDILVGPSLVREHYLKPHWKCRVKSLKSQDSRTATKLEIDDLGEIPIVIQMGDLQFGN